MIKFIVRFVRSKWEGSGANYSTSLGYSKVNPPLLELSSKSSPPRVVKGIFNPTKEDLIKWYGLN